MTTSNESTLTDDLNPAVVAAVAVFVGRITGMTPPPSNAFPPEWNGYLRELIKSIAEATDALAGDDCAHLLRGTPYEAGIEAMQLAQKWEERGIIVTIERQSVAPLAMGNHTPRTHAWRKREQA